MSCIFVIGHRRLWYMPKVVQLGYVLVLLLVFKESYILHSGHPSFYSLHQCFFPTSSSAFAKQTLHSGPQEMGMSSGISFWQKEKHLPQGSLFSGNGSTAQTTSQDAAKPDNEMGSGGQACPAWGCLDVQTLVPQ